MTLLSPPLVRRWIPARPSGSHKGDYGHALLLAGSRGFTGAALLASAGALRAGAGLVTAAVPASEQAILARRLRPEAMSAALPSSSGRLSASAWGPLRKLLDSRRITAVGAGPGLGVGSGVAALVKKLLSLASLPLVLDADGLNNAAGHTGWFSRRGGMARRRDAPSGRDGPAFGDDLGPRPK